MKSPALQAQDLYARLMRKSSGDEFSPWLAQILSQQRFGLTSLSSDLGLEITEFKKITEQCFNELEQELTISPEQQQRDELLRLLYQKRQDESLELKTYLLKAHTNSSNVQRSLATIIANACLGFAHLWQDLGMANRPDLSKLIGEFFPEQVQKNNPQMRWKKFFYKQLCEQEGGTLCRAPSCNECKSYKECFAPL